MSEFDIYAPGDWVEAYEGFYFICRFCKKENTGRANKSYCNDKCRYRHNNQQKRESKVEIGSFYQEQLHNNSILRKLHIKYGHVQWIEKKKLDLMGYIWNAANKRMKFEKLEGEWHQVGNYAFQIGPKEMIRIVKIKSI